MSWMTTFFPAGIAMLNGAAAGNQLVFENAVAQWINPSDNSQETTLCDAITVTAQPGTAVIQTQISNTAIANYAADHEITLAENPIAKITSYIVNARLSDDSTAVPFCSCSTEIASEYTQVQPENNGFSAYHMIIPVAISDTANVSVTVSGGVYATAVELAALRTRISAMDDGMEVAEIVSIPELAAQIANLTARVAVLETKYDEIAPATDPVKVEPPENGNSEANSSDQQSEVNVPDDGN